MRMVRQEQYRQGVEEGLETDPVEIEPEVDSLPQEEMIGSEVIRLELAEYEKGHRDFDEVFTFAHSATVFFSISAKNRGEAEDAWREYQQLLAKQMDLGGCGGQASLQWEGDLDV